MQCPRRFALGGTSRLDRELGTVHTARHGDVRKQNVHWFVAPEYIKCFGSIDALAVLMALPRQTLLPSFCSPETFLKPLSSIEDLAWPSAKLFAPATGTP
jgi:hypothetical protein